MTRIVIHGVGVFEVSPLPGQPQVAHCHALFVPPEYRGKGFGKVLKAAQNKYLQEQLFDYAFCTVLENNKAQKRILEQSGWEYKDLFFDRRQGCYVEVWGYCVPQGE